MFVKFEVIFEVENKRDAADYRGMLNDMLVDNAGSIISQEIVEDYE